MTKETQPIKRYPRGVDIVVDLSQYSGSQRLGLEYSNAVFMDLLRYVRPGEFIIGSNLLDFAFTQFEGFAGRTRWDMTIVTRDSLIAIVEAKRSRHTGWADKLKGFSNCLEDFREDPTLFPTIINTAVGQEILPPQISIPEDRVIPALFKSAGVFQKETARVRGIELVAHFSRVPIPVMSS